MHELLVCTTTGAWRQPYGSDIIFFYGSGEGVPASRMPQLVLDVSGPGTQVPVPLPVAPRSTTAGVVLERTSNSVTLTCEGGRELPLLLFCGFSFS